MRNILTALAIVANITPALADITGTWSTQAGCDWLSKQDDINAYPKDFETIAYLTKDGIRGWEWGCEFLSRHVDGDGQFVFVSSCSAEGDSWPELLLANPHISNGWQIVTKNNVNQVDVMVFPVQCKQ